MKVLFLITKSTEGGAQTHVYQLARALIARGDEACVMSAGGGWLEKGIVELGGTFVNNPYFTNSYNIFRIYKAKKYIRTLIKDFTPDLVSCHSGFASFAGRITIRNSIPTIFTAHGWSFAEGASMRQRIFTLLAEKFVAPFCAKIICVSEYDYSLAVQYTIAKKDKLVVIKNGVEIPQVSNVRTSIKKIIFIGRFSKQKNPLLLLQAFVLLPESLRRQLSISLVGDGPEYSALAHFITMNRIGEHVTLLGAKTHEETLVLLNDADLFILTTHQEGFPRSVLEALAHGVPAIASAVGGIPEIITPDVGILLHKNTPQEVATQIEFLSKEVELFHSMSKNAYVHAKENFSLEKMIEHTFVIYAQVIRE